MCKSSDPRNRGKNELVVLNDNMNSGVHNGKGTGESCPIWVQKVQSCLSVVCLSSFLPFILFFLSFILRQGLAL